VAAQEQVVVIETDRVRPDAAVKWAAFVAPAGVVDHARIVNDRTIAINAVQTGPRVHIVDGRGGGPHMVMSKRTKRRRIAPANQSLMRRRIARERRRRG